MEHYATLTVPHLVDQALTVFLRNGLRQFARRLDRTLGRFTSKEIVDDERQKPSGSLLHRVVHRLVDFAMQGEAAHDGRNDSKRHRHEDERGDQPTDEA